MSTPQRPTTKLKVRPRKSTQFSARRWRSRRCLVWVVAYRSAAMSHRPAESSSRYDFRWSANPPRLHSLRFDDDEVERPILIIADAIGDRRSMVKALGDAGLPHVVAASVDDWIETRNASIDKPEMPVLAVIKSTKDSFAEADRFTQRCAATIPIVVVSASGRRGDAARCRHHGVQGYLAEPAEPRDLIDVVTATLALAASGDTTTLVTRYWVRDGRPSLRVLVVDDSQTNRFLMTRMLEERGHSTTIATDGLEAIEMVERAEFDVVLMDVMMPGMDGLEATRLICERYADPSSRPLIVGVSAFTDDLTRDRGRTAGMATFLAKPIRPDDLFAAVEQHKPDEPKQRPSPKPRSRQADRTGTRVASSAVSESRTGLGYLLTCYCRYLPTPSPAGSTAGPSSCSFLGAVRSGARPTATTPTPTAQSSVAGLISHGYGDLRHGLRPLGDEVAEQREPTDKTDDRGDHTDDRALDDQHPYHRSRPYAVGEHRGVLSPALINGDRSRVEGNQHGENQHDDLEHLEDPDELRHQVLHQPGHGIGTLHRGHLADGEEVGLQFPDLDAVGRHDRDDIRQLLETEQCGVIRRHVRNGSERMPVDSGHLEVHRLECE